MPKKTITVDDLDLIFIRALGPDSRWGNVNLRDATEQQFDEWARSRATVTTSPDHEWDAQERAAFCDVLWQQDALVMMRRETLDAVVAPFATLADLDDATTERLHEALTKLSDRVRELWFLAPNNSDDLDVDVLRSQADDIISSIQAGLRPRKETPHAK